MEWGKVLLGFGPIILGTFAITYHKSIHESLIKFYNIKDYHLKPIGSTKYIIWGIVLIGFGLVRMKTS